MPLDQVVIDQNGPLPITKEFEGKSTAQAMLFVSGTTFTPNLAYCFSGVEVFLDNVSVGKVELYTSQSGYRHMALPARMLPVTVGLGKHAITLKPLDMNTLTDKYDYFQVVVCY